MCSYGLSLVCVHGEEKTWQLFDFFFTEGIVAFLCCVSFCCMAKRIRYTYIASQVALVVKNPPADAGDTRDVGSIPGLRRSPGVGISKLLQYLCLENSMNREEFLVLYNHSHQLSILYLVVYICQYSNLPIHLTSPSPTSFLVSVSLFSTSVSLFLLCKKIIYTIFFLILHLCLVFVQSLNCV